MFTIKSKLRVVFVQTLLLNKSIFSTSIQQHHTLPRLFIPSLTNNALTTGKHVPLSASQIHYLTTVLRLGGSGGKRRQSQNSASSPHKQVRIFNGLHGEWVGNIHYISKKEATIECVEQLRPQNANANKTPDCWVYFAPIQKPKRIKYMIEKCTEMGISKFVPIVTDRTILGNSIKWNSLISKWRSIAIEASEQCERLDVPVINLNIKEEESLFVGNESVEDDNDVSLLDIKQLFNHLEIDTTDNDRLLYVCCERDDNNKKESSSFLDVMKRNVNNKNIAFVVGPEGGWSETEQKLIYEKAQEVNNSDGDSVQILSLGDNILRAETAAIVSVAGWSLWRSCSEQKNL